jgi:deoxyxylulose-5-phosphate synthase
MIDVYKLERESFRYRRDFEIVPQVEIKLETLLKSAQATPTYTNRFCDWMIKTMKPNSPFAHDVTAAMLVTLLSGTQKWPQ